MADKMAKDVIYFLALEDSKPLSKIVHFFAILWFLLQIVTMRNCSISMIEVSNFEKRTLIFVFYMDSNHSNHFSKLSEFKFWPILRGKILNFGEFQAFQIAQILILDNSKSPKIQFSSILCSNKSFLVKNGVSSHFTLHNFFLDIFSFFQFFFSGLLTNRLWCVSNARTLYYVFHGLSTFACV